MHQARPLREPAPGEALRLDTSPPAKLPVRSHEATVVDGLVMVNESTDAPNLPPGLTVHGHI